MLEVCVRLFEPLEETPLGTVSFDIGVETVQGSAGIVCRDAYYIAVITFCLIHRWK